jgi:hypothetical protein
MLATTSQITSFRNSEHHTINQQMMNTEKKAEHQPDWTVNGIMAPLVY